MKKTILIVSLFLAAVSLNALGDGHLTEEQGKGAFTTLMVSAKDTDKYLKSVKDNNKSINILLFYTGIKANKAERVLKVINKMNLKDFGVSYGDGVGNVNINKL